MATNSDSQSTIFWDRLRRLFEFDDEQPRPREEPRRGIAITVCVVLSFILWLSLTLGEERTQTFQVPVEVAGTPEGEALAEVPPSHVQVTAQGRGLDLIRLLFDPPAVPVNATSGQVNVEEQMSFSQWSSVQLEGVTPTTFEMSLNPVRPRRVSVENRVQITPEEAYELIESPLLDPDSVQVRGARSAMRRSL